VISNTLLVANRRQLFLLLRLFALLCLFFLEMELVEIALRSHFDASNLPDSFWAPILGYQRYVFSFAFVFLSAFLFVCWPRLRTYFSQLLQASGKYQWKYYAVLQMGAFSGFACLTYILSIYARNYSGWVLATFLGWLVFLILTGILGFLSLAPKKFWTAVAGREKVALSLAGAVGFTAIAITDLMSKSWDSLAVPTMQLSETVLGFFYADVIHEPVTRSLGTSDFQVEVSAACAGYEGIGLIIAFLFLYLLLFRRDFRFPHVLLLFPIGIIVIWTLNVLRIAMLIAIGTSVSPEIAEVGFHSNAGWIAFILVSIGTVSLAHRIPYFSNVVSAPEHSEFKEPARMANALLVPMLVLLASILITSAFSAGFNWLYPVGVVTTGTALWYYRTSYGFRNTQLTIQPVLIGVFVFFIWMMLVPASGEKTTEFATNLFNTSPYITFLWLAFRFLGATITVPLAEELAFRGYLLSKLSGGKPGTEGAIPFTWLSFLVSSILFGLFHGAWLAGSIAGMCYALARYHRGKVADAVLAHLTTNLLLSLYVLLTGEWSYW
jgi:exosortase E/protease (VPEID-CTERM system)